MHPRAPLTAAALLASALACVAPAHPRPASASATDPEHVPAAVADQVRPRLTAIKSCYESSLATNPTLTGKLLLVWTITAAGTVRDAHVEGDTTGEPSVGTCIAKLVTGWTFAPPTGGDVEVSFPFVFQSKP